MDLTPEVVQDVARSGSKSLVLGGDTLRLGAQDFGGQLLRGRVGLLPSGLYSRLKFLVWRWRMVLARFLC